MNKTELLKQLSEIKEKKSKLRKMIISAESGIANFNLDLASIERKLSAIKTQSKRVQDHATVRYLERVEDVDLSDVVSNLNMILDHANGNDGNYSFDFTKEGNILITDSGPYTAIVRGDQLTTVLGQNMTV